MSKKKNNSELQLITKIVQEESTDCFINYNTEFELHGCDRDVQTVYLKEHRDSANPVEFHMLEILEKRIQEINPRYRIGIIFEEKVEDPEDFD